MRTAQLLWLLLLVSQQTSTWVEAYGSKAQAKPLPLVIAHRGASYYLPEETLEAYDYAAVVQADYLETDLCATKDHHLLCHHE